ncbi:MAG: sugar ABC transporter ATP-binding protein [bacterium]
MAGNIKFGIVNQMNSIELQNISKRFGGTIALDQVSFSIKQGEVHAVLGENGAGKSTLMRILSGVIWKDAGTITLYGAVKELLSPVEAQREGISTVYQEPNLVPHMSVAENIFLGHEKTNRLGFVDSGWLNQRAEEILANLELNIKPTTLLIDLAPAQVQLVQIARALAFSTKILILDEPTASITEHETTVLFSLLKKLNAGGLTIIYVSHRLKEIYELCHRVTVLRDGRYTGTAEVAGISERDLISMMVGRALTDSAVGARENILSDVRLELKNVSMKNAPIPVSTISLTVRKGEIVALAGLVGSGRSEVAKGVFGLNRIDNGELFLNGRQVTIHNPEHAISQSIGFVPEDRKGEGLILAYSIKHNISLAGLKQISKAGFINKSTEASLAREGLSQLAIKAESIDIEAATLSGGNQQKVVLAKWLWLKPQLLILDEPTRGIDVGAKAEIHRLIFELAENGISILLVSSELPEVLTLADRIYVMRDGHIAGELNRSEASQEAIMHLAAIGN